jgi:hypothetical protein
MNRYVIALFLHVSGAIGIWVSLGIWLFGLAALRRAADVAQVRAVAWLIVVATPVMLLSLALLGVAGFYMALAIWGLQTAWIAVSLGSMLVIAPIGAFVLDPRMHAILDAARKSADGPLPDALAARARDPVLPIAAQTMAAVLLGVVFLMTTKPALLPALVAMGVALGLGPVSAVPGVWMARRSARRHATRVDGAGDPFQRDTLWTRRF